MSVANLLIKLLEVRDSNRKLILQEYVKPLKNQITEMQTKYIDSFHSYRKKIKEEGITQELREQLAYDLDHILKSRAQVCSSLGGMINTSAKKLDRHFETTQTFADAIMEYLSLKDVNEILYSAENTGVFARYNDSYHMFNVAVENSSNGRKALMEVIDEIINQLQDRYRSVMVSYSATKSTMLTG